MVELTAVVGFVTVVTKEPRQSWLGLSRWGDEHVTRPSEPGPATQVGRNVHGLDYETGELTTHQGREGIAMAVREFTDSAGREWRAWDVSPDDLSPRTKDEDYLAQLYHTGWIVFETKNSDDKRRLYPIPKGWNELPEAELAVLLQKAEIVPRRKLRTEKDTRGQAAADDVQRAADFSQKAVEDPEGARQMAKDETPDVTDLNVLRTFRYPSGRIWVACVMQDPGAPAPVLRFTAGARNIDLADWPKDWVDYSDEQLVQLLRKAAPRTGARSDPGGPRRRWDDSGGPSSTERRP
jgi:hypothetical protein